MVPGLLYFLALFDLSKLKNSAYYLFKLASFVNIVRSTVIQIPFFRTNTVMPLGTGHAGLTLKGFRILCSHLGLQDGDLSQHNVQVFLEVNQELGVASEVPTSSFESVTG